LSSITFAAFFLYRRNVDIITDGWVTGGRHYIDGGGDEMRSVSMLSVRGLLVLCLVLGGIFAAARTVEAGTPGSEPVFSIFGLVIFPTEASTGQTITIRATVAESGNVSGVYQGTLKINGVVEETKQVSVTPNGSVQLTFTLSRNVAGTYSVDLNGLEGSFTVTGEPVDGSSGSSFPTIPVVTVAVAALVLVGLLVFYLNKRKAT
jgi:hypothetical protein